MFTYLNHSVPISVNQYLPANDVPAPAGAKRAALLVGSLPFASDEICMEQALDALGPMLFCLPTVRSARKRLRSPGDEWLRLCFPDFRPTAVVGV
ncbi:MAG TPA: hypothetical protein VGB67_15235 [Fibrella sp.]